MISLLNYYKYLRRKKYIPQLKKPGILREMVDSWNEARNVCLEDLVVTKYKKELENKKLVKGRGKEGWKEGRGKGKRGRREKEKKI